MEDLIFDWEKKLLNVEFCRDIKNLEEVLAAEFLEYGSSGKVYSRTDTINLLACQEDREMEIRDFKVSKLDEKVYLATYVSEHLKCGARSLRSSLWVLSDSGLQLSFHQGTPIQG